MSSGTISRTREGDSPSAPAITGCIVNGPWKFDQAVTRSPVPSRSECATTA